MRLLPTRLRRQDAGADPAAGDRGASPVAFVFTAGGSLGAMQVGAARALLEAGVVPDLVLGCSVGALNATFLAADPALERLDRLEDIWCSLRTRDVFGAGRHRTVARVILGRDHVADPRPLRQLIRRFSPVADLAHTAVPCEVVTTDLEAGRACYWSSGDATELLMASACLPGMFPPVRLASPSGGSSLHVDGGVLVHAPVPRALELGAGSVYVLDASEAGQPGDGPGGRLSALGILLRSFAVARQALQDLEAPRPAAHQRIRRIGLGEPTGVDHRDFSRTAWLIERGYEAARAVLHDDVAAPHHAAVA
ncbi:MAG TPA: patatin-like phospholipase family protein [Acidimicrobiales bacterium]|nr:patatin-like phospholipase family protein [Acidimicrobiales bacterium]